MLKRGLFITFEGLDGSGKTTISNGVYERLRQAGYDVIYTREPGGIDIAEQIRRVILDPKNTAMDAKTEALLYAASRRQHLVEKVIPALEKKTIVICDRFVDSSLAYQGVGRNLGIEQVLSINRFAIGDYMPDMTIYLNISAKTGLDRIDDREHKDRLDQEALTFHQAVERGYNEIIRMFRDRYRIVDANRDIESIINDSYEIVMGLVKQNV